MKELLKLVEKVWKRFWQSWQKKISGVPMSFVSATIEGVFQVYSIFFFLNVFDLIDR